MRVRRAPALALSCLVLAGADAHAQLSLVEVPNGTLTTDYYEALTNHGLGINWIDYDNDEWPDLFMVNGQGNPAHLYRNNGDGTFTNEDALLPPLPDVEMARSAFSDYDRDGDVDIYIWTDNPSLMLQQSNPEDGPLNLLLKNTWMETGIVPGQPLFQEVAQVAGVADSADTLLGTLPGMRAKTGFWFDYDRDGDTDLYVGHFCPQSGGRPATIDRLYRNEGDGTFTDVSVSSGLVNLADTTTWRSALASIGADLDGDLWPDMYVINTVEPMPYHADQYFRNNGDGTFTDVTALSPGVGDDCTAGMGIDVGDLDLDGDWDAYISDLLHSTLDALPLGNVYYLNNGDGTFQDNTAPAAGLTGDNSWGVSFFDLDMDGYEDIFLATMGGAAIGPSFVYRNKANGTFQKLPGVGLNQDSRGSATADYDRDGDLDVAQIVNKGNVKLLRNDSVTSNHWVQLKLTGVQSSLDAIGTQVDLDIGGVTRMRQVKGGSSAHSEDDLVVHFGLGTATLIDEIRVRWASGITDTLTNVGVDQLLHVVEGITASPRPVASLTARHLNWAPVGVGSTADLGTVLANHGNQVLTVSALTITNPAFSLVGAPAVPFDLQPEEKLVLTVRFAPPGSGSFGAEMHVESNDPDAPDLMTSLAGDGDVPTAAVQSGTADAAGFRVRAVPNPSPGEVAFDIDLPRAGELGVAVYDAAGRRRADLGRRPAAAGRLRLTWDGRSSDGTALPSGVYFYRITLDGEGRTRKLLLLR